MIKKDKNPKDCSAKHLLFESKMLYLPHESSNPVYTLGEALVAGKPECFTLI